MKALVSVVTPVYNAMPYLQAYLDSVLKQTWRPLQLICVDDGSTDASATVLKESKGVLENAGISCCFLYLKHGGQAAAVNAALPYIAGEFFTWCDADDLLDMQSIAHKLDYLQKHPELGLVRSNGIVIDGDTGEYLRESAMLEDKRTQFIFDALLHDRTYCYAGCYMMRTSLFKACYTDNKIPLSKEGQNLQLLLPAASRSECGFLDERLHIYCLRKSGHSSQKRSYSQYIERINNFKELKLELLNYCECDKEHFTTEIELITNKQRKIALESVAIYARKLRK